MKTLTAAVSGSFTIGADLTVNRLGFGSMRLTGKGVWGDPKARAPSPTTTRSSPQPVNAQRSSR